MNDDDLLVVISRHPYDIAGSDTDRNWTNCMTIGSEKSNKLSRLMDEFDKLTQKNELTDSEKSKLKEHWRHGVSPVRYAAVLRWGVAGFGWFTAYNLTPLFEKGKGPSRTDMSILTVGITINGL